MPSTSLCVLHRPQSMAGVPKGAAKNHSEAETPICISLLSYIRQLASKRLLPRCSLEQGQNIALYLPFVI